MCVPCRKCRENSLISPTGAGVPITSSQLYSAGHTDDIRQALIYIAHRYPKAPLLGVGFSLGANVLTRYVAEEGENSRVLAACALGCVSLTLGDETNTYLSSRSHGI
jgi:predicted alpha/beta-fold hydrolase